MDELFIGIEHEKKKGLHSMLCWHWFTPTEREGWHITPQGTSLLESDAPLHLPPSPTCPLPHTQSHARGFGSVTEMVRANRTGEQRCRTCSPITTWYNAIFFCKRSHVNSLPKLLKRLWVQHPRTIQQGGFYITVNCAKSLWLNGSLVGINSK